jgi:hypothetical protein
MAFGRGHTGTSPKRSKPEEIIAKLGHTEVMAGPGTNARAMRLGRNAVAPECNGVGMQWGRNATGTECNSGMDPVAYRAWVSASHAIARPTTHL